MRKFIHNQQGASIVEAALAGVPIIFILISTFEIGRGMWAYTTLANAVRETSRYATLHGQDCTLSGNSCSITVGTLASHFATAAIGLPSSQVNVSFVSLSDNISCNPLHSCMSSNTVFPSTNGAGVGNPVTVTAVYTFTSAISFFSPGSKAKFFAPDNFKASSTDYIEF